MIRAMGLCCGDTSEVQLGVCEMGGNMGGASVVTRLFLSRENIRDTFTDDRRLL